MIMHGGGQEIGLPRSGRAMISDNVVAGDCNFHGKQIGLDWVEVVVVPHDACSHSLHAPLPLR